MIVVYTHTVVSNCNSDNLITAKKRFQSLTFCSTNNYYKNPKSQLIPIE